MGEKITKKLSLMVLLAAVLVLFETASAEEETASMEEETASTEEETASAEEETASTEGETASTEGETASTEGERGLSYEIGSMVLVQDAPYPLSGNLAYLSLYGAIGARIYSGDKARFDVEFIAAFGIRDAQAKINGDVVNVAKLDAAIGGGLRSALHLSEKVSLFSRLGYIRSSFSSQGYVANSKDTYVGAGLSIKVSAGTEFVLGVNTFLDGEGTYAITFGSRFRF